jgi:tetratricopeptide (TPR) repeat protein
VVVTTFCRSMTGACARSAVRSCLRIGEAKAPVPEPRRSRSCSGAGAALISAALTCAVLMCAVLAIACGDDTPPASTEPAPSVSPRAAADPAAGMVSELDGVAATFGDAVLAELTGEHATARAAFERLLAAPDVPASLAARAALHLAQMESSAGNTQNALDLATRAKALAPNDASVSDGVNRLRGEVLAVVGAGGIRGPRPGTPLPGARADVAAAWAKAEARLVEVYKRQLEVDYVAILHSIDARITATDDVVELYRAIAEHRGIALVAAKYRIGSLYYDLANDLAEASPPRELDHQHAAQVQATLDGLHLSSLNHAVKEYTACLDAPQSAETELWRLAAETDLRLVRDVLKTTSSRNR